jgi:hypothetical protein
MVERHLEQAQDCTSEAERLARKDIDAAVNELQNAKQHLDIIDGVLNQ